MNRTTWVAAGSSVLVIAALGGVLVASGGGAASAAARGADANTVPVQRGELSDMVSLDGILTYRARSDGSPFSAINNARGTYTQLPDVGDQIRCGDVLYRVDNAPVLLLCGSVPAYRALAVGAEGEDVRQLHRNLRALGYDGGDRIDPDEDVFTSATRTAVQKLQRDKGTTATGRLDVADAIFLPEPVRIAGVRGELGGSAQAGTPVLDATTDTLEVSVQLAPSRRGLVKKGDVARITLPGNVSVGAKVDRLARDAAVPAGQSADGRDADGRDATIAVYLTLDDPAKARGLDRAPVQVDVTTAGVQDVLSVPVTALVGRSGGGFAVEVVRDGGLRELVPVKVGLFDDTAGRVEVGGEIAEGDHVVVPSAWAATRFWSWTP